MSINFSNNDTLDYAATAQRIAAGGEGATFTQDVTLLTITYASKACWIANSAARVEAEADGTSWDRIYIPEGAVGLTIPWNSDDVWFLNAVADETPFIAVVGHK